MDASQYIKTACRYLEAARSVRGVSQLGSELLIDDNLAAATRLSRGAALAALCAFILVRGEKRSVVQEQAAEPQPLWPLLRRARRHRIGELSEPWLAEHKTAEVALLSLDINKRLKEDALRVGFYPVSTDGLEKASTLRS